MEKSGLAAGVWPLTSLWRRALANQVTELAGSTGGLSAKVEGEIWHALASKWPNAAQCITQANCDSCFRQRQKDTELQLGFDKDKSETISMSRTLQTPWIVETASCERPLIKQPLPSLSPLPRASSEPHSQSASPVEQKGPRQVYHSEPLPRYRQLEEMLLLHQNAH